MKTTLAYFSIIFGTTGLLFIPTSGHTAAGPHLGSNRLTPSRFFFIVNSTGLPSMSVLRFT